MLKFEIIESTQRIFKNKLIKLIIEKMKFFQGIELSLKNRITPIFIIAEARGKKICGGACLLKKKITDIQEDLGELVTTLTVHNNTVWECSTIYFEPSSNYPLLNTSEVDVFLQNFYRGLYEELVAFGSKKKVSFIIMKLLPDVYVSTKKFGLWPYVVELKPQNSPDGLFHGILPLAGSQYEAYQNTWRI
ncbi:MAG: hypothetical protein HYX35_02075 [Proteobacteria bacterium]|nr:hypothetical protein [Pseudomonadota bacterium]